MSESGKGAPPSDALSAEVVQFLEERVDSVPHLETLLIMWESAATWDARRMAARTYVSEAAAQAILQDLQRTGLATTEDRLTFRFDNSSELAQALVPKVAQAYRRNVTRIATLIHNKASRSVREFARAFDFKKER
jgi:hypothetical protein